MTTNEDKIRAAEAAFDAALAAFDATNRTRCTAEDALALAEREDAKGAPGNLLADAERNHDAAVAADVAAEAAYHDAEIRLQRIMRGAV